MCGYCEELTRSPSLELLSKTIRNPSKQASGTCIIKIFGLRDRGFKLDIDFGVSMVSDVEDYEMVHREIPVSYCPICGQRLYDLMGN